MRSSKEKQFLALSTSQGQLCPVACKAQACRTVAAATEHSQVLISLALPSALLLQEMSQLEEPYSDISCSYFPQYHYMPWSMNSLQGLLLISFRRDLVKCVAGVPRNSSCWPQPALGFSRCNICSIYEEKNQNNTTAVEKKTITVIYCSLSVEIERVILTLQKL